MPHGGLQIVDDKNPQLRVNESNTKTPITKDGFELKWNGRI